MPDKPELLTPKEYATLVRVHVKTVLRWVREDRIVGVRDTGKGVRIPAGAVVRRY